MNRFRLIVGRDDRLKYVAHLDMMRVWERVFRRAALPLAYSEGFSPHPRLSTAAPLAVGMTSTCELVDVYLESDLPLEAFLEAIRPQLPSGLSILAIKELDLQEPSAASSLCFAEYEVGLESDQSLTDLEDRLASVLAATTLPQERVRDKKAKRYDLRPLIEDLRVSEDQAHRPVLWMRLQSNSLGAGRPDEVLAELGIATTSSPITRVGLVLSAKCAGTEAEEKKTNPLD